MTKRAPRSAASEFWWGTATSAYQIEGATSVNGRGPSTWDTFCAEPGRIADGSTGEVSCDHYRRYAEDVALMGELGVNAYRFSIAWPRVLPTGVGPVNDAGLDFYDRLVDALLAAGVTPVPTLFHWDTPQPLEDAGGWLGRDIAHRFADYVDVVAARLADRVHDWITINEPRELTMLGYALGVHAPGRTAMFDALPAAHHLLLGHGLAADALHAAGVATVGVAASHAPVWPASDEPADTDAAALFDLLDNWLFADALVRGSYPEDLLPLLPPGATDDLPSIGGRLDWYGVNYYNPIRVGAAVAGADQVDGITLPEGLPFSADITGVPMTDFGWPVVPEGLTQMLRLLVERYGDDLPPLVITENGCSYADGPGPDGRVHDVRRIDYLRDHLGALDAAVSAGVDVRGYFCWSLLDNFEWAEGYRQRFGLVHVDFATGTRTPKDSFGWYAEHIRAARG
ncbi:GH1 family beta-glucosidase [Nocardioides terrisoli]|uniref:GH1 family beta-glucosidase n=1 Tax=Nocardioides terrisoli TaxID=3388267 RepID=UPI00287B6A40|nr:GH1 family beta-glucosidase [Nocardioides marmorisolisilvae]